MEVEGSGGNNIRRRRFSADGRDEGACRTLGKDKQTDSPVQLSRTLLDVIRDEEPNTGAYKNLIKHHNTKKNWNAFKDRLRSCHSGARHGDAVRSSINPPASGPVSTQNKRPLLTRRSSTRLSTEVIPNSGESAEDVSEQMFCDISTRICSTQITHRNSVQESSSTAESADPSDVETDSVIAVQNNRGQLLRLNSSRLPSFNNQLTQSDPFNELESATAPNVRLSEELAAEREQIQRVVSSSSSDYTEESEPENEVTAAAVAEEQQESQPVRMSLMDLLEETDRQMGWVSYTAEVVEDEEDDTDDGGDCGGLEYNCCVCMVRHKGAAFIPCGHAFCRLCSRELWVSRGNCPLCNGYILEILDIF